MLLEWMHLLTFQSYGGSGYGFTRGEVLAMPADEIEWFIKRADLANRDMAAAIQRAKAEKK